MLMRVILKKGSYVHVLPDASMIERAAHICALLTFFLIPVWLRLSLQLPDVYVLRFLILLPALATITLWALTGFQGWRTGGRWRHISLAALIMLAVWGAASTQWAFMRALEPEVGISAAIGLIVTALFAAAVSSLTISPRAVTGTLAFGLLFLALIVIGQAAAQSWLGLRFLREFEIEAGMTGISVLRADGLEYIRPYGLMPHPNMTAGALVIGTLAAAAWIGSARRVIRFAAALLSALGVLALLLTFSRAAWIGLAVGGIVLTPVLIRRAWKYPALRSAVVLAIGAVLMAGGFVLAQYTPLVLARTGQIEESIEMRSVADRLVYIDFAIRSIAERPFQGVGIGNFPWRTSYFLVETFYDLRGDNVHNIYLAVWAELGTVGFVLFGGALLAGLIGGFVAVRNESRSQSIVDNGLTHRAALIAIVLALLAIGWLDHYPYSILHFQIALWGCLMVTSYNHRYTQ